MNVLTTGKVQWELTLCLSPGNPHEGENWPEAWLSQWLTRRALPPKFFLGFNSFTACFLVTE